jgi:hypothetical protein
MKPGLLDICVIILSLAMAVILALDIVALVIARTGAMGRRRRGRQERQAPRVPLRLNRNRLRRTLSPKK